MYILHMDTPNEEYVLKKVIYNKEVLQRTRTIKNNEIFEVAFIFT